MKKSIAAAFAGALLFFVSTALAEGEKAMNDSKDGPSLTASKIADAESQRPLLQSEYAEVVSKTAAMVHDGNAQRLVKKQGLNLVNLTWEDTGRYKNSAVGPNISDMTIQVALEDSEKNKLSIKTMPVIRYPNFSDRTADVDPRDFTLLVGNEKGEDLKRISLYEFLENPTTYLSKPDSWKSPIKTLHAERDSKVLVSAQACFLPVPKEGKATFNPVIFNYQSISGDPAVLTVLATREGTSTTVIDNKRDGFREGSSWGQRLFHNANGQRASLTGERLSDFEKQKPEGLSSGKGKGGLNMVMLIQIPLKQKNPMKPGMMLMAASADYVAKVGQSDVEAAVIGHGDLEGPFTEIDNLSIERDPNFPVRVTVQFYRATSNGVVSKEDVNLIKEEIDDIYAKGENSGSLVVGGETGRITEYAGAKVEPVDWWEAFWKRYQENTGESPAEAKKKLQELLGKDYEREPITELYLRDHLRGK